MGLHARYYLIAPTTLAVFIANWHSEDCRTEISRFRQAAEESEQKLYIGTTWQVLDRIINPPEISITELRYAVRGHGFPAPDGAICAEPLLPSYRDEYWQIFAHVTAEEVARVAPYLSLIDRAEFDSRLITKNLKGAYREPRRIDPELREEYWEILRRLQDFYQQAANAGLAIFMIIG